MTTSGISLLSVVRAFNSPINEEQAWALCYQTIKNLVCNQEASSSLQSPSQCKLNCRHRLPFIHSLEDLVLRKDGSVEIQVPSTSLSADLSHTSTCQGFLSSLGVVLFQALDYGLDPEKEERCLEPGLEILIKRLISADNECVQQVNLNGSDSGDEGIERDSGEDDTSRPLICLEEVLEICSSHLSLQSQTEVQNHYRAVCRALVVEAEELLVFLDQISRATRQLKSPEKGIWTSNNNRSSNSPVSDLSDLETGDWARLWMQVIRQLRTGVRLKKVDQVYQPRREFALTPYEMLLNDIRSQRHKLKHVTPNEDILHRVKKDAHELILDFIRSRPPLVPAARRSLRPKPQRQPSIHEKLMHSIRQKQDLKPTPRVSRRESVVLGRVVFTECTGETPVKKTMTNTPTKALTPFQSLFTAFQSCFSGDWNICLSE